MEQKVYSRDLLMALKNKSESLRKPSNLYPGIMRNNNNPLSKNGVSLNVANEFDDKTERLYKKIYNILNKLSDDNFQILVQEVHFLKIDNRDKMEGVLNLIFETALKKPNCAKICAKFCQEVGRMYENSNFSQQTNIVMSRNLIINKCQKMFETHTIEKTSELLEIKIQIINCTDYEQCTELSSRLIMKNLFMRTISTNNIIFIGEVFKLGMLTFKIMQKFLNYLIDHPHESNLECLCKLLTNISDYVELNLNKNLDDYYKKMEEVLKNSRDICPKLQNMMQLMIVSRKKSILLFSESTSADKMDVEMQTTETIIDSKETEKTGNLNVEDTEILNSLMKLLMVTEEDFEVKMKPESRQFFQEIKSIMPTDRVNKKIRFVLTDTVSETSAAFEMNVKMTISTPKCSTRDRVQFDCRFVHNQLLELIKEKNIDEIKHWILENVGEDAQNPMFVQILMLAIFETSVEVDENNRKLLDNTFGMLVEMIQHYVDQDSEQQKRCLKTVRDYLLKVVTPNSVTSLFYKIFYKLQDEGLWNEATKILLDVLLNDLI